MLDFQVKPIQQLHFYTCCLHAAGVSNLIQQVCRLSKGLRLLNLSKTSLTSKGLGPSLLLYPCLIQ